MVYHEYIMNIYMQIYVKKVWNNNKKHRSQFPLFQTYDPNVAKNFFSKSELTYRRQVVS